MLLTSLDKYKLFAYSSWNLATDFDNFEFVSEMSCSEFASDTFQ
ncbi:23139_t:CDS:2, partial [Dentiscutata erythropus]